MNQQNYNEMKTLKIPGVPESYEALFMNRSFKDKEYGELLRILLDHEESIQKSNKLGRLLKQAAFPEEASIENILYDADRKLNN
ncbi:hypothetical protein [Pseudogracilibacillus sp. SO10305]|uniref:hypothetical protein n=1 Tax=Pseudogracilibacillus sp. SO10305 TaxID=3098292 RepID=UPI00300E2665